MSAVAMTVNGKSVTGDVDPRTLLVQFLREHLRLTGTHVGCDTSQCGACVVLVDGKAVKSCTIFAWQVEGGHVAKLKVRLRDDAECQHHQRGGRERPSDQRSAVPRISRQIGPGAHQAFQFVRSIGGLRDLQSRRDLALCRVDLRLNARKIGQEKLRGWINAWDHCFAFSS